MSAASAVVTPRDRAELQQLLQGRPGRLRLVGSGSRQSRLPDAPDALRLQLRGLATIDRLDGPDQTCSVDCGVLRTELDAALAPLGLELPCPGQGTLGGLFASDALGAATLGGQSPRTLLLGMEALLADGTPFRAGARVVKSVAGFDVHKLLVGSEGRLFVATRLHLRLKPRPRAEQWFTNDGLELPRAIELLRQLRQQAQGPAALQLQRHPDGRCTVRGRLAGRAAFVAATARELGLRDSAPCWQDHVDAPAGHEVLAGQALPSALPALLAAAPATSDLLWHGGHRFELTLPTPAASDAVLAALPKLALAARLVVGAPARRSRGTALDPGTAALTAQLHRALDPHGILV